MKNSGFMGNAAPSAKSLPAKQVVGQEGYSILFHDTQEIVQAVIKYEKQFGKENSFDQVLLEFARKKLGLTITDPSEIKKLIAGQLVRPVLANAVRTSFPKASYRFAISRKFNVRFLDIGPIARSFQRFQRDNQQKYAAHFIPEQFARETLNIKIGSEAVAKLLNMSPISPFLAEAVLVRFPELPFELIPAKTGRPRKASIFDEMRQNGAEYGFVPMGSADRYLVQHVNDALEANGIKVRGIKSLSPGAIGTKIADRLHFIANVCPACAPSLRVAYQLYDVELTLGVKCAFSRTEDHPQVRENYRIAVVQGSPEHLLSRTLSMHNVVAVSCPDPESEYESLSDLTVSGRFDAALLNHYSLFSVVSKEISKGISIDGIDRLVPIENFLFRPSQRMELPQWLRNETLFSWNEKWGPQARWRIPIAVLTRSETDEIDRILAGISGNTQQSLYDHIRELAEGVIKNDFDLSYLSIQHSQIRALKSLCFPDEKGDHKKLLPSSYEV
jgi:hypothetical protein